MDFNIACEQRHTVYFRLHMYITDQKQLSIYNTGQA